MTETKAILLFKCLADKSRLQILKSLAIEDMYVERLAERLGITAPTVSFHLKKLADAGAVTSYKSQYYMMYSLNKEIFETSILEIIREKSDEADLQAQANADAAEVIDDLSESTVTLTTTPGFYYSFEYGTTLDNMAEVGTRTLATGSTLTLPRPTTANATAGFYKVLVNVVPATVTP